MSKKHFIKLAEAIARITDKDNRKETANVVADVCAESNALFKRSKFLEACQVDQ